MGIMWGIWIPVYLIYKLLENVYKEIVSPFADKCIELGRAQRIEFGQKLCGKDDKIDSKAQLGERRLCKP